MKTKTIKVSKDFSEEPYGRYYSDGEFSGERFREEFVLPALRECDKVVIDLDGSEGYNSSFLEECFGGLVRKHNLSPIEIKLKLELISTEDESYLDEIQQYIDEAMPE